MRSLKSFAAFLCVVATAISGTGCDQLGITGPEEEITCYDLTHLKTTTTLPAKVTVAFKAQSCEGAPAPNLTADLLEILENGELNSLYESKQVFNKTPQNFRSYTILVLDMSGSVLGDLATLKASASSFVKSVINNKSTSTNPHYIAVYGFDNYLRRVIGFSNDQTSIVQAIENVNCGVNGFCSDDTTNLNGAIVDGLNILESQSCMGLPSGTLCMQGMTIFTDGKDRANRTSHYQAASAVRNTDALVYTIGLGREIDQEALKEFGKSGFTYASDAEKLNKAFTDTAKKISDEANSYYVLEYCSPARSGSRQLEIRASRAAGFDGEGVTTSFSANGFTGGCTTGTSSGSGGGTTTPSASTSPAQQMPLSTNPKGGWTYGSHKTGIYDFTKFTNHHDGISQGLQLNTWSHANFVAMLSMNYNPRTTEAVSTMPGPNNDGSTYEMRLGPGQVAFYVNPNETSAGVLRWTPTKAGRYQMDVTFKGAVKVTRQDGSQQYASAAKVALIHNTQLQYNAWNSIIYYNGELKPSATPTSLSTSRTLDLKLGDHVTFTVATSASSIGDLTDVIAIDARITPVN